ncbi:hypothetical protein MsAg5_10370 [Methanosarcinaceae archaeon Ag5]|uniref:Uncharacterized protein n=2 Tax=Methanolapillus africanus TaxID=3028297 RepID=A0AAE4SFB4_9EURY|nr:hypothetical protein [Methanosarcinaceae archaeon Ag5]
MKYISGKVYEDDEYNKFMAKRNELKELLTYIRENHDRDNSLPKSFYKYMSEVLKYTPDEIAEQTGYDHSGIRKALKS